MHVVPHTPYDGKTFQNRIARSAPYPYDGKKKRNIQ